MLSYYIAPGLSYNHLNACIRSIKVNRQIEREKNITLDQGKAYRIMLIVSDYFGITIDDLKSASRHGSVKTARQIAQDLIRWKTKMSLKTIAKLFNRDHSTVLYSCQTIADLRRFNKFFDAEYKEVESYV